MLPQKCLRLGRAHPVADWLCVVFSISWHDTHTHTTFTCVWSLNLTLQTGFHLPLSHTTGWDGFHGNQTVVFFERCNKDTPDNRVCVRSCEAESQAIDKSGMWALSVGRLDGYVFPRLKSQLLVHRWNPSPSSHRFIFRFTSLKADPHHCQGEAKWRIQILSVFVLSISSIMRRTTKAA